MKSIIFLAFVLWATSVTAAIYVWPSVYDEIEDLLSLQVGYQSRGFIEGVTPCSFGGRFVGRQNAAEWIRTAFHDMITYDDSTKTGGIDGSIFFETDRAENKGAAFNNTFSFFGDLYSTRASAADLVALGVVVASGACGGERIAFRAGRKDATFSGPSGVPEAFFSIDETTKAFTKAGYNTREMITLVTCGHTLGGVHSKNSPEIVGGVPSPDTVTPFDSSFDVFDPSIATEYFDGTSKNPLLVNKNDTFNSDKRVFAADGNVTMRALAKPRGFKAYCADIFERMIDTVPQTTELTLPISATNIKPYIHTLSLNSNGTIAFGARIRIRTTVEPWRNAADLKVWLNVKDRTNKKVLVVPALRATLRNGFTTGLHGETFIWHDFNTTIAPEIGTLKFTIQMSTASENRDVLYNNAGYQYPLLDTFMYQKADSCVSRETVGGKRIFNLKVVVRKERANDPVTMNIVHPIKVQGTLIRKFETEVVTLSKTGVTIGDWVVFSGTVGLASSGWKTSFDLVLGAGSGGKEIRLEFLQTEVCARVIAV